MTTRPTSFRFSCLTKSEKATCTLMASWPPKAGFRAAGIGQNRIMRKRARMLMMKRMGDCLVWGVEEEEVLDFEEKRFENHACIPVFAFFV